MTAKTQKMTVREALEKGHRIYRATGYTYGRDDDGTYVSGTRDLGLVAGVKEDIVDRLGEKVSLERVHFEDDDNVGACTYEVPVRYVPMDPKKVQDKIKEAKGEIAELNTQRKDLVERVKQLSARLGKTE